MNKDDATMKNPEIYSKLMECNKEFVVNYLLYLDECLTKYESALDKACVELNDFTEFVPVLNLPFEGETYTKFINSFDEEECINLWKEWLLKEDE